MEIVIPAIISDADSSKIVAAIEIDEDAAAKAVRLEREKQAHEQRLRRLQSLVVQRNAPSRTAISTKVLPALPRPILTERLPQTLPTTPGVTITTNNANDNQNLALAEANLLSEIRNQILRDAYDFPDYLGNLAQPPEDRPPDLNTELTVDELLTAKRELAIERELLMRERQVKVGTSNPMNPSTTSFRLYSPSYPRVSLQPFFETDPSLVSPVVYDP